jgi:hypothetical protein
MEKRFVPLPKRKLLTVRLLLGRLCFVCARIFQGRGLLLGQWFQNKGILLLTGVKVKRD